MLICVEAAQAVLEGMLAGLTLKLDDETEYCPRMLADLALKMNFAPQADEPQMEYFPRKDEMEYSPHADVEMISPLSDSIISQTSKTGSTESDGVYSSHYARAQPQYVRRRHPYQDVRLLESASDSSFRLRSHLAISPAARDLFHHKKA